MFHDFAKDRLSGQAMSTSKKSSIKNSSLGLAVIAVIAGAAPLESRDADTVEGSRVISLWAYISRNAD